MNIFLVSTPAPPPRDLNQLINKGSLGVSIRFVHNLLTRINADVTYCEKTLFYFQNKGVYLAEVRPTDICLQMNFTS